MLCPIGKLLVQSWRREIFSFTSFNRDDIFLLAVRPESAWAFMKPIVAWDVVAFNSPLLAPLDSDCSHRSSIAVPAFLNDLALIQSGEWHSFNRFTGN